MSSRSISLRMQLTALCSLLTVLAFVWTGVDSYQREHDTLTQNLRARLTTLAKMVSVNVISGVEFDSAEDVRGFLQTVQQTMELQAAGVYLTTGQLFASSGDQSLLPTDSRQQFDAGSDHAVAMAMAYKDANGDEREGRGGRGLD